MLVPAQERVQEKVALEPEREQEQAQGQVQEPVLVREQEPVRAPAPDLAREPSAHPGHHSSSFQLCNHSRSACGRSC